MRTVYQQHLLEHYRNSPFKKQIPSADIVTQLYNPSCGDKIAYQVVVQDGTVAQIGFEGSGCVLSVAAASLLAEYVQGKPLHAIAMITVETMRELIGMPVGPVRLRCIVLPLEALQKGVAEYIQRVA